MCSSNVAWACPHAGFPIRRSTTHHGCTHLIVAFRSVPRPSSALDARASPVRLFSLRSVMRRPRSSLCEELPSQFLGNGQWAMSDELTATACCSATFDVRLLSRTLTRFLVIECSCHNPCGLRSFAGTSVRVRDAASRHPPSSGVPND